jgi:hypothetical protein
VHRKLRGALGTAGPRESDQPLAIGICATAVDSELHAALERLGQFALHVCDIMRSERHSNTAGEDGIGLCGDLGEGSKAFGVHVQSCVRSVSLDRANKITHLFRIATTETKKVKVLQA